MSKLLKKLLQYFDKSSEYNNQILFQVNFKIKRSYLNVLHMTRVLTNCFYTLFFFLAGLTLDFAYLLFQKGWLR